MEFELSVLDNIHDEFALLLEAFPVSVVSCVQIYVVFHYVQAGWLQADYFSPCAWALSGDVCLTVYLVLGFVWLLAKG